MTRRNQTKQTQQTGQVPTTRATPVLPVLAAAILLAGTLAGCVEKPEVEESTDPDWKDWFLWGEEIPDGLDVCEPLGDADEVGDNWAGGIDENPGPSKSTTGLHEQFLAPIPDVDCHDDDLTHLVHIIAVEGPYDDPDEWLATNAPPGSYTCDPADEYGQYESPGFGGYVFPIMVTEDVKLQVAPSYHIGEGDIDVIYSDVYRTYRALQEKHDEWASVCPDGPEGS